MMFGESPFSTAPFSSYADEVHNAFVSLTGPNAVWNTNIFTVNGNASISLGSADANWNASDFILEGNQSIELGGTGAFSIIVNMPISLTGAEARFNEDIRVWLLTTPPTRTFIWTLESNN